MTWLEDLSSRQAEINDRITVIKIRFRFIKRDNVETIGIYMLPYKTCIITTIKYKLNTNATEWTPATSKMDIERVYHIENETKFRQTQPTPLMQPPYTILLGYIGDTHACEEILNGTFSPPFGTPAATCTLFKQFKLPDSVLPSPPLPTYLSDSDFKQGWKQMKEITSAELSDMTFSHMKACATLSALTSFEACMATIPYATGMKYSRWCIAIKIMLLTPSLSTRVGRLRTILLLEAGFNFNNNK